MMNTILLKESEIKKLVSMRDIIEIVDKTFVDLGEGKTINPTKLNLNLGDSEPTNLPYKASLNAPPILPGRIWLARSGPVAGARAVVRSAAPLSTP